MKVFFKHWKIKKQSRKASENQSLEMSKIEENQCLEVSWGVLARLAYLAMHTHCYDNVVVRFKHFFDSVVGEVEVLFSYVWFKNSSMCRMG